jgi:hypothetical protein
MRTFIVTRVDSEFLWTIIESNFSIYGGCFVRKPEKVCLAREIEVREGCLVRFQGNGSIYIEADDFVGVDHAGSNEARIRFFITEGPGGPRKL